MDRQPYLAKDTKLTDLYYQHVEIDIHIFTTSLICPKFDLNEQNQQKGQNWMQNLATKFGSILYHITH